MYRLADFLFEVFAQNSFNKCRTRSPRAGSLINFREKVG